MYLRTWELSYLLQVLLLVFVIDTGFSGKHWKYSGTIFQLHHRPAMTLFYICFVFIQLLTPYTEYLCVPSLPGSHYIFRYFSCCEISQVGQKSIHLTREIAVTTYPSWTTVHVWLLPLIEISMDHWFVNTSPWILCSILWSSLLKLAGTLLVPYSDVIMSSMAYQISGGSIVSITHCSSADKRIHQSSACVAGPC